MRHDAVETANDRFKRRFGSDFWYSIVLATALHLVLFTFWPAMTVADLSRQRDETTVIPPPPEIDVPPAPEQIIKPAKPVISDKIDPNLEIKFTVPWNEVDRLPPPPTAPSGNADLRDMPQWTPMTVRPELRNTAEIERLLIRNYPPMLRDVGIGGTPVLWFFIDASGRVLETRVHTSSGYPALDEAAQKVAGHMRFSPALNHLERVPVWVEIPMVFRAR